MHQDDLDPSQKPAAYVRWANQAPGWLSWSLLVLPVAAGFGWLVFEQTTGPGGLSAGNVAAAVVAAVVAAVSLAVWTVLAVSFEQRRRSAWPASAGESEPWDERVVLAIYDVFWIRRLKREMRRKSGAH